MPCLVRDRSELPIASPSWKHVLLGRSASSTDPPTCPVEDNLVSRTCTSGSLGPTTTHATSKGIPSRMYWFGFICRVALRDQERKLKMQWSWRVLEKIGVFTDIFLRTESTVIPSVPVDCCLSAAEFDTRFSAPSPHPIDNRHGKASGKNHSNLPAEVTFDTPPWTRDLFFNFFQHERW